MMRKSKTSFFFSVLFIVAISLFFSGCMVGPNVKTPDVALPKSFLEKTAPSAEDLSDLKEWWKQFEDPYLNNLIEKAITQNYSIRIAKEKIEEFRAFYHIERPKLLPEVNALGSVSRYRTSQNVFGAPYAGPPIKNLFITGFDATWEIDFFGKIRRSKEAAYYQVLSEIESLRDVTITLISEVAKSYIELCSLQEEIVLIKKRIKNEKEILRLTADKHHAGLVNEQMQNQAKAFLDNLQTKLPILEAIYKETLSQLGTLLGQNPEDFFLEFQDPKSLPKNLAKLPKILPSELLRRRPDIRKAEQDLASATAKIGAYTAELFPSFSLLGAFGWESDHANKWFHSPSQIFGVGPGFNWNILDFGRIRAKIRAQTHKQKQALLSYENTIISALKDVENSLIAYYKEQEKLQFFSQEVSDYDRNATLEKDLFEHGLKPLSSCLDIEQQLLSAEDQKVQSQKALIFNIIALYKALGGDWSCSDSP
jgi:NodT family efflux transporter outer membrane factor (OMF) lipoprotein